MPVKWHDTCTPEMVIAMVHDEIIRHFRRPEEIPFMAGGSGEVTMLSGGLTWKQERLIRSVRQRNGYRSVCRPQSDHEAHKTGKKYSPNNLRNPLYFTAGNLISWLRYSELAAILSCTIAACCFWKLPGNFITLSTVLRGAGVVPTRQETNNV